MFNYGDPVLYMPENKIYDFAYYSHDTSKAIIYERGCHNMQDSYCVDLAKLKELEEEF